VIHRISKARRPFAFALALSVSLGVPNLAPITASASGIPSLRVLVGQSTITVQRFGSNPAYVYGGTYLASVGGAFQLDVSRPNYRTPVGLTQVDTDTGAVLRTLPSDLLRNTWGGLVNFLQFTVRDAAGHVVSRQGSSWCPNDYNLQRVDDSGPLVSRYPFGCYGNPFTRGMVWGVDAGWAVTATARRGLSIDGPDGSYTVTTRIRPRYQDLLAIPAADASATITVVVQTVGTAATHRGTTSGLAQLPEDVPIDTSPDPSTIPDLRTLPAWSISVTPRRQKDFLSFAATEWNAGPQRLSVEGFRQDGAPTMDAFQYFFDDAGNVVGKAPVGTMAFDDRRGHQHWHFEQFVRYTLLDSTKTRVVRSHKQSFCLAPTDPIDLTVHGADWNPGTIGLGSVCGDQTAIWIREDVPTGWGDTYVQYVGGQAFNITGVPNGVYFVQVKVNPLGALYETNTRNDTTLRRIRLRGTPGNRTVVVSPWHGIGQ
jgi:hypothetical protein